MSEGYRKAALRLHAMGAPDRAWVLGRLAAPERTELSALLRELQQLGIEPDRQLAEQVGNDEVRQSFVHACSAIPGFPQALDAVCAAPPAHMAALLASEPNGMAAAVLSVYPWPWRAGLLADYGVDKRQAIGRALLEAPQLKPRVRGELVKLMAARLGALRADRPDLDARASAEARDAARPGANGWMKGLRRWLP